MNCPHCGIEIEQGNASACPHCGAPLEAGHAQSAVERATAPSDEEAALPAQPIFRFQSRFATPATPRVRANLAAQTPGKLPKTRRVLLSLLSTVIIFVVCAGCILGILLIQSPHKANFATATPLPGTTPGASVLFQDPLTSNANGWSDTTGNCFFQDNAYHVKDNYICFAPAGIISDANISVQAKQVAGSLAEPYGIVFRQTSANNWYEFYIDSNSQWVFDKVVNGTIDPLVGPTDNAAIKGGLNTVNTLAVQAKGTHFVFLVNGTQVGQADDATFARGQVGLAAGGEGVEAAFNNIEITAAS